MVSSKDVAKYAGVSQTTVSRVLNTPEIVKKPTVDKVMNAIEVLNYIPNANARSLVQKKTGTIALLSGPLHNPFFVDTTAAIVNYANERGYRVNVQFVNDHELTEAYSTMFENKVDGIILSCILLDDPIFMKLKKMQTPFITYNRKHSFNEQFVEIDNYQAGYLAAKHLIDLGHRSIAWIGGTLSVSTYKNRFQGFMDSLKDHDIENPNEFCFHTDSSKKSVAAAFAEIFQSGHLPTAVCGGADLLALSIMDTAIKSDFLVPNDLSIIGIDNVDLSSHGSIQLTTVGATSEVNLGLVAIEKLIEIIENKKNSCICITESVNVIIRNTTKAIV